MPSELQTGRGVLLGVDTGGTFTDLLLLDADGHLRVHKCLSTPDAPERAILSGMSALAVELDDLRMVHGSTVATNAVLESRGVRTAYVTNTGFADVLTIGRQARRELYNLQPAPQPPPVSPQLCFEVEQRSSADGEELLGLSADDLKTLQAAVREAGVEAVAINLLFSWKNDSAERLIETALLEADTGTSPDAVTSALFVSRSSKILPEQGEYERGIATWLNAYVGPLMQRYLLRLQSALGSASVSVMQSSGTTVSAEQAAERSVNLLLSGPAGGLRAARYVGDLTGDSCLLTFDMGGTSTDVAMLNGDVTLTDSGRIAGYPVAVPMVDMHTIGAGGGSIASVDAGGLLMVGPRSAGASPGPACYGAGGRAPTVTDANVVLGRLPEQVELGGALSLDTAAARAAMEGIAESMAISVEGAARGVIEMANEHMAAALRVISVERGVDPAGFTLMSFGGAGGLHVCALAERLGMQKALVPMHSGVLSALGMVVAPRGRQLRQAVLEQVHRDDGDQRFIELTAVIDATIERLVEQASDELRAEGVDPARMDRAVTLALRYSGQSFSLELPYDGELLPCLDGFNSKHEQRYGHCLNDRAIEVASVSVGVSEAGGGLELRASGSGGATADSGSAVTDEITRAAQIAEVAVDGEETDVPVYTRDGLPAGAKLCGPAIIVGTDATVWLQTGWKAGVDDWGNLRLAQVGLT